MNAPATPPVAAPIATIRGRIRSMRRSQQQGSNVVRTVIVLPAADAYSPPSVVELLSAGPLGEVGQEWTGKVRVGGYGRSYQTEREDPHTGEIRKVTVQTADNTLSVVE